MLIRFQRLPYRMRIATDIEYVAVLNCRTTQSNNLAATVDYPIHRTFVL